MKGNCFFAVFLLGLALFVSSCGGGGQASRDKSSATGWKYNDPEWGGFE
jgi:hypothetical protein